MIRISKEGSKAIIELQAGEKYIATPKVIQELGRLGLAYRPDMRKKHSKRIFLTTAGWKLKML